jgi:sialidase-1
MDARIVVQGTGVVYQNPTPHLRSVVAYHPTLTLISNTEYLATFDIGEAVEAFDYHTVVARSTDGGETWKFEGRILKDPPPLTTHSIRTSILQDGSIVGFGGFHRRKPGKDLVNRKTFGLVPIDLFTVKSSDGGRTWSSPDMIQTPLKAPSWEICHCIVEAGNGRWIAPTSTWRGWDGEEYSGDRAVVLISDDHGQSWPLYGVTFDGQQSQLSYLEQSVITMNDQSLLAVSWVYELNNGTSHPTAYSISRDHGLSFTKPKETGLNSQTCKIIQLIDGRLLCVYRANDRLGLWATLASFDGSVWVNLCDAPLWQGADSGMHGTGNRADELSNLKFGHPTIRQLSDQEALVLFWCQESCITGIRWIKLNFG